MQIVTYAVRIDVALTFSRRRSLFAPRVCVLREHTLCRSYGGLISSLLSGKGRRLSVT